MKKIDHVILMIALSLLWANVVQAQEQLPDLSVASAEIAATDLGGNFVTRILVRVSNTCEATRTTSFRVRVTGFFGGEKVTYMSEELAPLSGGKSWTFNFFTGALLIDKPIRLDIDSSQRVAEADETNNWWTFNPKDSGLPVRDQSKCVVSSRRVN